MLITIYDSYNILTKVYSKGEFLKQAIQNTQIEELNRAKVTKICYGVLDKDVTLSYIISKLCDKSPKLCVRTILKISLYLIIYLKNSPYAVTDNAVELLNKLGKSGMKGFLNAILRKFLRDGYEMPTDMVDNLSIKYSYPKWLVEKLIKDYDMNLVKDVLSYDKENTYIRFSNNVDGENYLQNLALNYEKTPFKNTFLCNGFKMEEGFYLGKYTFQSIGSVAICDNIESGNHLLDVCSAPGGKAVNLSTKFNRVTATELHKHRVSLIESYVSRMGATNVEVFNMDMSKTHSEFIDKFDAVLVDAPCSGSGVLKDNPDIKLNRKKEDILSLNIDQKNILNCAKNYVLVGGYLYYSTCSILKDENSRIIAEFLKNNDNFIEEKINSKLPSIKDDFGLTYLPNISSGAGFYFCKLKRIK